MSTGNHTITAIYASDSLVAASDGSVTQAVQVINMSTTTTLTSSPNPSVFGQTVTFTAAVSSGAGTPTGTVTFQEGANVLASAVPVDGTGHASFNTTSLSPGSHVVTANFTGSNGWGNSSGSDASAPQVVNKDGTTTVLASSLDPSTVGRPVTFTATVSVTAPGSGTPAGTVTFRDKNTTIGTGALDATGRAVFTTSTLSQGAHQITASYGGSAVYAASTSQTLVQNVSKK